MTSVLEYHRGNDRSSKVFNSIFEIFFDGRSSSEDYSNDFQPIILDHFFRIKINNNLNNLLKSQDQSSKILNHQWSIFIVILNKNRQKCIFGRNCHFTKIIEHIKKLPKSAFLSKISIFSKILKVQPIENEPFFSNHQKLWSSTNIITINNII